MIFVDTSAIYAILDQDDKEHNKAKATWVSVLDSGETLLTSNYVLVECCALAQHRLGLDAVRAIEDDLRPVLKVKWIDEPLHRIAMTASLAARRRKLSLVDCSSFALMRQLEVRKAFAFDQHFIEEGFLFPAKRGA